MRIFPTARFCFDGQDADIERRTVTGGTSLAGDEDTISTDGGGRVYAAFSEAYLDEPELALAWRTISALAADGLGAIIVPLGDYKHQMMGNVTLPPGGLPWWSEDDFPDSTGVTVGAPAALRATQIELAVNFLPQPLRTGIWLSIDHSIWRHRAYRIMELLSDDGATAVVSIRPPLRQAVAGGEAVDVQDPKCVMKVDGPMGSPTTGGFAEGSVRFVEDFSGAYA